MPEGVAMSNSVRVRVIVAGSRHFDDIETFFIWDTFKSLFQTYHPHYLCSIVSGGAKGIDRLGEKWAKQYEAPCKVFLPDWDTHGKAAGPIRNRHMAEYAAAGPRSGALVLIWDGKSKGSASMLSEARKAGVGHIVQVIIEKRAPEAVQGDWT